MHKKRTSALSKRIFFLTQCWPCCVTDMVSVKTRKLSSWSLLLGDHRTPITLPWAPPRDPQHSAQRPQHSKVLCPQSQSLSHSVNQPSIKGTGLMEWCTVGLYAYIMERPQFAHRVGFWGLDWRTGMDSLYRSRFSIFHKDPPVAIQWSSKQSFWPLSKLDSLSSTIWKHMAVFFLTYSSPDWLTSGPPLITIQRPVFHTP